MESKKVRVGLTGGIASGKSTVAAIFALLGADIIDADAIAKLLTQKNHPNIEKIIQQFGNDYVNANGELNRKALRQLISADKQANNWLKQLLHPQIFQTMMEQSFTSTSPYCILMIPLLAESNHDYQLDRTCVVDCPEPIQMERLQARDTLSAQHAISLSKLQTSREQRLAIADDIIINDHDLPHLEKQVHKLHQAYLALAKNHK